LANLQQIKKPSWFLNLTEGTRATIDFFRCLLFLSSFSYQNIGQNRPVMVVPGFLGSDFSTKLLRRFLSKMGFVVYGWELGRNYGNVDDLKQLHIKIKNYYQQHDQKIILIGWSLGGVYVREIAKQLPDLINQVITLGSPFAALEAPNHAKWIFEIFGKGDTNDRTLIDQLPIPANVMTTAVYSKLDGVVPWEACMEQVEDKLHQNIEVASSHLGFCINKNVFKIIVNQLQK
jgi:pimeloyl-ACP methyl ester carboxylesterase